MGLAGNREGHSEEYGEEYGMVGKAELIGKGASRWVDQVFGRIWFIMSLYF